MRGSKLNPPRQVIAALALLTVHVLLGNVPRTLLVITGISSGQLAGPDAAYEVLDALTIWGFSIGFLVLIAYGFNWARWVNLVLAVGNVGLDSYFAAEAIAGQRYLALVIPLVSATLELVVLYLLFLSPGRLWFERRERLTAA
jgi:hypothetical protein